MKRKIFFTITALALATACAPQTPTTSTTPSPSNSAPVITKTPEATPIPTVSNPIPTPTTVASTTPVKLDPIYDNYRLIINGKVMEGSKNTIYNKIDDPSGGSEGRIQMASFGYETVTDGSDKYSFRLTIMPGNMNLVPLKFNQSDFASVLLEVKKESSSKTSNYKATLLTGSDKEIPLDKNANNQSLKGLKSSVLFESLNNDNSTKRYKGSIEAPLASDSGDSPLNVKFEWNYVLTKG